MATDKEKFEQELVEAQQIEDNNIQTLAPTGAFSSKKMNGLVIALNNLSALFGWEQLPRVTADINGSIPNDIMRKLLTLSAAIDDAITEGILDQDNQIDTDISDDHGLLMLSSAISKLTRNKKFKRFLEQPIENTEATEEDTLNPEELFNQRI